MRKQKIILMVLVGLVLGITGIFIGVANAAPPPDTAAAMGRMNTFMQNVGVVLNNILNDGNLQSFVNALWNTFTIMILVSALFKWNFGGIRSYELVHPLLLILITRIMLNNYDMLTGLFWDWSEGIAGGIQSAVLGNTDPFFLVGFVEDVVAGIETSDVGIMDGLRLWICGFVVTTIILLLSLLSFLASTWALYGYALSKIIGWFFIPFIMVKRLSYMFDGWVRLFTGFIVYGIIARANLLLAVLALKSFYGIPGYTVNTNTVYRFDFTGIADLFGLAGFMLVSILALISTGRFATAIVSGASGFGSSISTAAYTVARVMKGF
jgi:hypothetical protein